MSAPSTHDLCEFHRFVGEKIHNGETTLTPEQVLDEWRVLQPAAITDQDDLEAIQEAIDSIKNGDVGVPFEEFDRDFRTHHNLRMVKPSKPAIVKRRSATTR